MKGPFRPSHERRLQLLALGAGLPGILLAFLLSLSTGTHRTIWLLFVALAATWLIMGAVHLHDRALHPLQTLANLLTALREGDYSFRAKENIERDALGDVYRELNTLSELLQQQRIGTMEATALLRSVMEEIDVAIFAFDGGGHLRLINRAGEQLVARPQARALGASAEKLGLADALQGPPMRLLDLAFPGRAGRFELRRNAFRQGGRPHQLLVLSDLTRPLREEERQAWQRLIRVLSHEINNSLAPIHSIAGSLGTMLHRDPPPEDLQADLHRGLDIIATRSEGLKRFLEAYAKLAKLPVPSPQNVDVAIWIHRVAKLETRLNVAVEEGPALNIQADGDQLDQLLINLVRNAADAALDTSGGVSIRWALAPQYLEIRVEDEGLGLPISSNLFVPFFTTKPTGSGIGLVLSRQISEAHGGSLVMENRTEGGARAILRLPIQG